MNYKRLIWRLMVIATLAATALPADAEAQRRRPGPRARQVAVRVVPVYRPFYGFGFGYGPYYPYHYYPSGSYRSAYDPTGAVRVQVDPEPTEVYVDGYFAGVADDFDGFFQRLRLPPGEYEILLRLEGYRTVTERLLLTRGSTLRIRHTMEPLGPGEVTPPPPEPIEPIDPAPRGLARHPEPGDPVEVPEGAAPRASREGFATLALRVQPPDATVLIDGERWQGPNRSERLSVEVGAGVHVVEIQKTGYQPYQTRVEVIPGETLSLNVSLPRLAGQGS